MTVLQFGLKSFFRPRKYSIARDGAPIGEIECTRLWEGATITLDGTRYAAARDGMMSGAFFLETNGSRVVSAGRLGAKAALFTVRAGERTFTLKKPSLFSRAYVVTESDAQIGAIAPASWFGRWWKVELPDGLGLDVQAFLIWLVIVMQRRAMAQSAVISGVVAQT